MVFSQDKVLQRFVEQLDRVQQRFVEQNFETPCVVLVKVWRGSGGAVLRCDQFARAVSPDIVSSSSSSGRDLPSCSCDSYGGEGVK